jgi:zinc transporter 7
MGEHQDPGAHFVMVEEKRNILIGSVEFPNLEGNS